MAERKTQLKIEVGVKDQATKAFDQMGAAVKRFGGGAMSTIASLASKFTGFGALLGGIGAALSVPRLFSFIEGIVDLAQEVEDLSSAFGVTVESMSAVASASKAYGIETDQLTNSLKTFAKVVDEAAIGSRGAQETLQRLGVTVADIDGAGGDLVGQLSLVADGFGRLDGSAAKATLATELFGKQGLKMLELLGDGSEKFRELIKDVEATGAVFDRAGVQKAAEFERAMARLKLELQGVGQAAAIDALPKIVELITAIKVGLHEADEFLLKTGIIVKKTKALPDPNTAAGIAARREPGSPLRTIDELEEDASRRAGREFARQQSIEQAAMEQSRRFIEQSLRIEEQVYVRGAELRARSRREAFVARDREIRQIQELAAQSVISKDQEFRAIEALAAEHARRMRELDGTVLQGFEDGMRDVLDKWTDFYAQGREAAESFASGLQAAFSAASQVLIQNIKNIEAAWKAFGDVFIRVLADMLTKLLAARLAGLLLGVIFPGGGQEGGSTGTTYRSATYNSKGVNSGGGGGGGGGGDGSGAGPQGFGSGGGGFPGGGGGTHVETHIHINTIDSRSFEQRLSEHAKTIQDAVEVGVSKGHNRSLSLKIGNRR